MALSKNSEALAVGKRSSLLAVDVFSSANNNGVYYEGSCSLPIFRGPWRDYAMQENRDQRKKLKMEDFARLNLKGKSMTKSLTLLKNDTVVATEVQEQELLFCAFLVLLQHKTISSSQEERGV